MTISVSRFGRGRRVCALAVGVTLLMGVSACSTSSPPAGSDEQITLTLADKEVAGQATDVALTQTIAAFEDKHPNVTIKRDNQAVKNYNSTFLLSATGSNPPDIFQILLGPASMGPLVEASAVVSLDKYAKKYGWDQRFPASMEKEWRFTTDGKTWGDGSLYGVSNTVEMTGVYYNKAKLSALGLDYPSDFAGFEAALAAAKAAGEVPIQFGNAEGWPGGHTFMPLENTFSTPEQVQQWVLGDPNAPSFAREGNIQAAQTLQDWSKAGYFANGFSGTTYEDAMTKFIDGKGLFFINGSWANATLAPKMGDNLGFAFLPRENAGDPPQANGQSGVPYGISSKCKHPDLAAEFLDMLTGANATETILSKAGLPAVKTIPDGVDGAPTVLIAAWKDLAANGALIPNTGQAAPGINDIFQGGIQELLAGKTTPQAFVDSLQKAWEAAIKP